MSSSLPFVSHAVIGVSFSFVKNNGNSSFPVPRLALGVCVRSPLKESFCLRGEGVDRV